MSVLGSQIGPLAFRYLQTNSDFPDVTLACEYGHQAQAHMLILTLPSEPLNPSIHPPSSSMEPEATLSLLLNAYQLLRSRGVSSTLVSSFHRGGIKTTLTVKNPSKTSPSPSFCPTSAYPKPAPLTPHPLPNHPPYLLPPSPSHLLKLQPPPPTPEVAPTNLSSAPLGSQEEEAPSTPTQMRRRRGRAEILDLPPAFSSPPSRENLLSSTPVKGRSHSLPSTLDTTTREEVVTLGASLTLGSPQETSGSSWEDLSSSLMDSYREEDLVSCPHKPINLFYCAQCAAQYKT